MRHIARKRFGQHFLVDQGVIEQIVEAISPQPEDCMVEIGPGMGAMTLPLLKRLKNLCVVELDKDLVRTLELNPRLKVVSADVLTVSFDQLASELTAQNKTPSINDLQKNDFKNSDEGLSQSGFVLTNSNVRLRVVGNLPYNISTPVLFHLLNFVNVVEDQHFMLQKEVVARMVATPSTSEYGRLSVMLQWRYQMDSLFDVEPDAFDPPPRVRSAVVKMIPRTNPPELEFEVLQSLVQVAFSQRRKLLRHTLGRWLEERQYQGSFDEKRRAEEVGVDEYIALAQELKKIAP